MPIHEGAVLSDELLQSAQQVATALNGRLEFRIDRVLPREAYLKLPPEIRRKVTPPAIDGGVNVTIYDPTSVWPQRIGIESAVQETMLLEKVTPVHLPQTAHDAAVVQLAVVVAKDGTVIEVKPLGGPESLIEAAMEAVRHWRYRPTLLNGMPVEVQTSVEVTFTPNR
jgi:hypothetical protein